jgi:O-acetyl-ADP-ribose deacetylase (regulator of RNase III)
MRTIEGDLIELAKAGHFDVIAHGCNCMGAMGAGLAKAIRASFPESYEADRQTAKGDRAKLGTCSVAICTADGHVLHVANAYTQFDYRGPGPHVDYGAVRQCMAWIGKKYKGSRIGLPLIGAGLAGGDWPTIEKIIGEELRGEDVTIVKFPSAP